MEITNLHKHFGQNHVLRGIDLSVHQGEVVVVIVPAGQENHPASVSQLSWNTFPRDHTKVKWLGQFGRR